MSCRPLFLLATHAAAICVATSPVVTWANPSSKEPSKQLDAHGTIDGAAALVKSLYELYNTQEAIVIELQKRRDKPASLPYRQIESASGKLWKARRDAKKLQLMGEPAGHDLAMKFPPLALELKKLALMHKTSPAGGKRFAQLKSQLQKETAKRNVFLAKAGEAIQAGKLEAVEAEMERQGVTLYERLALFSPTESKPFNQEFDRLLGACDAKLNLQRREEYREVAQAAMEKHLAGARQFNVEAARIAQEIAAKGTAAAGGQSDVSVVAAFRYLGDRWGFASAGITRIAGLQFAFTGSADLEVMATSIAESERLARSAAQGLAGLIEAAAESTPSEDVARLYSELLGEVATLDRRGVGGNVAEACNAAMAKLAAKDPGLTERVERYRLATSEALVWRRRYADMRAKTLQQDYPALADKMREKSPVKDSSKPALFGGVSSTPQEVAAPTFSVPANWGVVESASRLIGQSVSDGPGLRLTRSGGVGVVPFQDAHYVNLPIVIENKTEVDDLKRVLLVDDTHGPLTVEAADAISAASLHDYQRVGGAINRLHLEAAVTRMIRLPDVAYALVPMGTVPKFDEQVSPTKQTCWRMDLTPHWVQHKYFVSELEQKAQ